MKTPAFFRTIRTRYGGYQRERSRVIQASNEALTLSKRAIFALHRDDRAGADQLLAQAVLQFKTIEGKSRRFPELGEEGSLHAALEEYAEAVLFRQFLVTDTLSKPEARIADPSVYLAALSDFTGEVVRWAIRQATAGNADEVKRARVVVEMAVGFLLELDLTGYLRQKFDQAKKNLHAIEGVQYDLSLSKRTG